MTMLSTSSPTSTILTATPAIYRGTVIDRMRERMHGTGQRGFGTLDVLLGMTIAALIITIGGLNIGKIRDNGQVSESGQEAERMAQALESSVTDNYVAPVRGDGGTPTNPANHFPNWGTGASVSNMSGLGVVLKSGTTIRFYRALTPVENGTYTFCAVIQRGSKYAYSYYDSRQRDVVRSGMLSAMPTATQCQT